LHSLGQTTILRGTFHGAKTRMSSDFDFMTARELARRIARRELSPVEATRRALGRA